MRLLALGPDLKFRSYAVLAWIIHSRGVCATASPVCVGWRCGGEVDFETAGWKHPVHRRPQVRQGTGGRGVGHAVSLLPNSYLVIVPDGIYWETDGAESDGGL
jgi:hypothetical protein